MEPPYTVEYIAKLRKQGKTWPDIAKVYNKHPTTVQGFFRRNAKGNLRKYISSQISAEERAARNARIYQASQNGISVKEIAKKEGLGTRAVHAILEAYVDIPVVNSIKARDNKLRQLREEGLSYAEIGRRYDLHPGHVSLRIRHIDHG